MIYITYELQKKKENEMKNSWIGIDNEVSLTYKMSLKPNRNKGIKRLHYSTMTLHTSSEQWKKTKFHMLACSGPKPIQ